MTRLEAVSVLKRVAEANWNRDTDKALQLAIHALSPKKKARNVR